MALPQGARPYTGEVLPLPEGAQPFDGEVLPLEAPQRGERVAGAGRSILDAFRGLSKLTPESVGLTPERIREFRAPDEAIGRGLFIGAQGANEGIANIAQLLTGRDDLRNVFRSIGAVETMPPETLAERFIQSIGREGASAGLTAGTLGLLGRLYSQSPTLLGKALQQIAQKPAPFIATETAIGGGAGAGMQAAREVFPGSDVAEIAGAVAGGSVAGIRPRVGGPEANTAQAIADLTGANNLAEAERLIRGGAQAIREGVPGANPTLAATVDARGMTAVERQLAKTGAAAEQGAFADRYAAGREAVRQALQTQDVQLEPSRAGQIIRGEIAGRYEGLLKAREDAVNTLYENARLSTVPVDTAPVLARIAELRADTKGGTARILDQAEAALKLDNGQPDNTARGLIAARKEIDRIISTRGEGAGDSNAIRMLSQVKQSLDEALNVVPEFRAALDTFAEKSRPLAPFQAKEGAPTVERVLARPARTAEEGVFRVPTSEVADEFVGSGTGVETWKELVRAAGGNKTKAVEAAQNVLEQRLLRESSTRDGVTSARLKNFISNNRELLREAFGQEHFARLNQIESAVRRLEQPQRPIASGSDTATLFSPALSRVENSIIGRGLKRFGALNPMSPQAFTREAIFSAIGSRDERYQQLLREAFLNPQLAADLVADLNTKRGRQALDRLNVYVLSLGGPDDGAE